ncbi:hypothetical protein PI125_g15658 [Phytophthora idaei]|nr:hypothetical protein PI125_g15658 [Phytophthora idaei]
MVNAPIPEIMVRRQSLPSKMKLVHNQKKTPSPRPDTSAFSPVRPHYLDADFAAADSVGDSSSDSDEGDDDHTVSAEVEGREESACERESDTEDDVNRVERTDDPPYCK